VCAFAYHIGKHAIFVIAPRDNDETLAIYARSLRPKPCRPPQPARARRFCPSWLKTGLHYWPLQRVKRVVRRAGLNGAIEVSKGVTEARSDTAASAVTYSYRATVLGAPRHFTLSDDGIDWKSGAMSGHIPYRNIRRLVSMQSSRFITELWGEGTPRLKIVSISWKSMVEQERLDRSYSVFVRELHRRISKAASSARFERGTNPWAYWPGLAIFVAVALGLAGGAVQALQASAYTGAAFVGAFLALYLWQIENFLRRNRPGTYNPEALPKEVMPPP